jgi:hypothetical protein
MRLALGVHAPDASLSDAGRVAPASVAIDQRHYVTRFQLTILGLRSTQVFSSGL